MSEQDKQDKTDQNTENTNETPTTLLLVRHGNTPTTGKILPGRAAGLDLSDQGLQQAEEVAQHLSQLDKIAAIYSSPLERAQQTAAPLAKLVSKEVQIHELLYECDFGEWTGRELKELYKLPEWQQVQKSPSTFRFPSGESFMEMQARAAAFIEFAQREHKGQIVVAYSHADPIKTFLCSALGMHLDMFQRLMVGTCSVSAISYTSSGPVVLGSNWHKTLSVKVS